MSAMSKVEHELERAKGALTSMRKRAAQEGESIMETGVGLVSSMAMGVADAKWGEDAIFGTSIPAVVGAGSLLADLSGWGGAMSPVLRATGRAGINIEGFRWAQRKYREWDEDAAEE